MLNYELDQMIDWCKRKLSAKKKEYPYLTGKRREGYEEAMLNVMSYLHSLKKED